MSFKAQLEKLFPGIVKERQKTKLEMKIEKAMSNPAPPPTNFELDKVSAILKDEIEFTIDPLNKFETMPKHEILEILGILPEWGVISLHTDSAYDAMLDQYQFGGASLKGGKILESGAYKYPDDPILYPLAKMIGEKETIFFYQYSMIGIVNKDNDQQTVFRMD